MPCQLDIKFVVIIIPCYAMIIFAKPEDLYTCNYPYLSEISVTKKVALLAGFDTEATKEKET